MVFDLTWLSSQFPQLTSIAPLDSGGQKSVFKAVHQINGDVVLKIFHPQSDVERVRREILAVQEIQSSRTPQIIEVGVINLPTGPLIWLIESFVNAPSLRNILARQRPSDREILILGRDLLQALDGAEQAQIVHRDVKPDNILFDINNGGAWLLDFGLSRHLRLTSVTPSGNLLGACTPGYGPPEQFRNKKGEIDGRADLFAVGVTLFECVEGVNPFVQGARDQLEMLRRVEATQLPALSRDIEQTGDFTQLVLSMTRIRRDHRPRTVRDALDWILDVCNRNGIS